METTPRRSLHPLVAAAAVAVIIFSAVGVGAITGIIPTSRGNTEPNASPIEQSPAGSPAQQSRTPRTVVEPSTTPVAPAPARQAAPLSVSRPAPTQVAVAEPARPPVAAAPVKEAAPETPPAPVEVTAAEPATTQPVPKPICFDCGTVESVRAVKQAGDGSGLGAVAGGVAGALLGNQIGGGSGRKIAAVVGAVGGAVAGHQVEKHVKSNTAYVVTVRMDDGSVRTFNESSAPSWRTGDKVRVQGDRLTTQS